MSEKKYDWIDRRIEELEEKARNGVSAMVPTNYGWYWQEDAYHHSQSEKIHQLINTLPWEEE